MLNYTHKKASAVEWVRENGFVIAVYILATWFTNPWTMGDTVDYVDSVLAYEHGRNLQFWEFGHLFWRPLAWVIYRFFKPLTSLVFVDERARATLTLIGINWISGLVSMLILRALLKRVCNRNWIINLATVGFVFCSSFLNYGETGSAYGPGIALSLIAGLILVRDREQGHRFVNSLIAGCLLGLAVCLWFPFVLLVPAMLALPLCLHEWRPAQVRVVLSAGVVSGLATLISYAIVVAMLKIHTIEGLKEWVIAAGHDINQMRGVPRLVFGFANSLIDLSGEGVLFKRYLKNDPFNPVKVSDLFRFSLYKLIFAYLFLFCTFLNLLRSARGRWLIALLVIDLLPTFLFALFIFEAGDMSRYISTMPVIFLGVGYALCSDKAIPWTRYVIILFIAAAIITNVRVMSNWRLNQREQRVESRIRELVPILKPQSRVATSHLQDELNNFTRDFLFNPINRNGNLSYAPVVAMNATDGDRWRSNFASVANEVWSRGGDMWVSKRLVTERPRPEWNWVEGDDPRISWTDLYKFFSQFEFSRSAGADDGFLLLEPTNRNLEILKAIPPGK